MTLEDSTVHLEVVGFGYILTLLISVESNPKTSVTVTVRVTSTAALPEASLTL